MERWSNGKCVSGADPCDDGFACTQDVCTESAQLCTHLPDGPDCANCGECDKTCAEAGTLCGINDCEENCGECDTLLGDICLPDIGCRNESTVMGKGLYYLTLRRLLNFKKPPNPRKSFIIIVT